MWAVLGPRRVVRFWYTLQLPPDPSPAAPGQSHFGDWSEEK